MLSNFIFRFVMILCIPMQYNENEHARIFLKCIFNQNIYHFQIFLKSAYPCAMCTQHQKHGGAPKSHCTKGTLHQSHIATKAHCTKGTVHQSHTALKAHCTKGTFKLTSIFRCGWDSVLVTWCDSQLSPFLPGCCWKLILFKYIKRRPHTKLFPPTQ